jgi:hypothetical protein
MRRIFEESHAWRNENLFFVEESQVRNLALTLDGVPFTCAEIESCVALDQQNAARPFRPCGLGWLGYNSLHDERG